MRKAFTLVELLTVIAIMGALAAIAIPSARMGGGPTVTNSAAILGGILDNARQEAVAKNVYVGVALGNVGDTLWITAFAADNGANIDWSLPITLPAGRLRLITAPRSFARTILKTSGEFKPASLPDPDIDPVNINALAKASVTVSGRNLTRLLVFTPGGQALSDAELNQYIEFAIVSARDNKQQDPAVFRVSGNLGIFTVYRN
ncbi:MAG: prepilin-type N-terminal cleavage/methylation domain-containing protein [Verrucomicrobiales bacterium]|jgi:prepilin-type N-terminal cleavage/methylation domain-containing protein|nr:prepilin-type N-terminal cleavage/methylation domain-containing protein [Verrucomicrobiales bacterium]